MNSEEYTRKSVHLRFERILTQIDRVRLAQAIASAIERARQQRHPVLTRVIHRAAAVAASVGALSATPTLIPGPGTVISLAALVPEEMLLLRIKCIMLLRIAAVFGFDPTSPDRLDELLWLAAPRSLTQEKLDSLGINRLEVQRVGAQLAIRVGRAAVVGTELGTRLASRGVLERLPAVGLAASAAVNFLAVRALGRKAVRFYAGRARQRALLRASAPAQTSTEQSDKNGSVKS
jgi:hypothetical protein